MRWIVGVLLGLAWAGPAAAQDQFRDGSAYMAERDAACRRGDLEACARQGQTYWAGVRAPQNLPLAVDFLGRACEGGRLASCVVLARLHAEAGPHHRPDRAMSLFERACAGGEVEGCAAGAVALRNADGRTYREWPRAESFMRRACERNDIESCWRLGVVHVNGDGAPQDFGRAAPLLEKACRGGRRQACVPAAQIFGSGRGVPEDGAKAESLVAHGCELGDSEACGVQDRLRAFKAQHGG